MCNQINFLMQYVKAKYKPKSLYIAPHQQPRILYMCFFVHPLLYKYLFTCVFVSYTI
jgi:hypothetical protein